MNIHEYVEQKYPEKTKLTGTVFRLLQFGYFVEIDNEEEHSVIALIHKGQYSLDFPLVIGDKVEGIVAGFRGNQVYIVGVEKINTIETDIHQYVEQKYPEKTKLTGTVSHQLQFGYFVEIDNEDNRRVMALIHKGHCILDSKLFIGDLVSGIVAGCYNNEVYIVDIEKNKMDIYQYVKQKYPEKTKLTGTIFYSTQSECIVEIDNEEKKSVIALIDKRQSVLNSTLIIGDRVSGIVARYYNNEVYIVEVKKIST